MFSYSFNNFYNFTPFVKLMRRRHLDNTTFSVFPKRVVLKRKNNNLGPLHTMATLREEKRLDQ